MTDEINTSKSRFHNHILNIIWLCLLLLPQGLFFYLFVPVSVCFLFSYRLVKKTKQINQITLLLSICITFSMLTNVFESYVERNDYFRAFALIIIFSAFGKLKGVRLLPSYVSFGIVYLALSQFSTLLPIPYITEYFRSVYPPNEFFETSGVLYGVDNITLSKVGISRLGGLFYNPNVFASYMGILLCICLCEKNFFKPLFFWMIIGLSVFSLISTGSRTAMLIMFLTFMLYWYLTYKTKEILLLFILVAVFAIIFVPFINIDISNLRGLKIGEGMDDSFGVKLNLLNCYIDDVSIVKFLFGSFSGNIFHTIGINTDSSDFDLGNIFIYYGIIFYVTYIIFYVKLFKHLKTVYKIFIVILFWSFSNSLIMSYRMAPFWLVTLSVYYKRSKKLDDSNYKSLTNF